MKTKKTKSWVEKYQTNSQPQVKRIEKAFADIPQGGLMLIATPQIIEDYLKEIPPGKTVKISTLRQDLALEHQAEYTCPLTTGIFLRIVAEANYEALAKGKTLEQIAPFWRVIDEKMPLSQKLSFGTDFIKERRAWEAESL
jgi:hypothetical protein